MEDLPGGWRIALSRMCMTCGGRGVIQVYGVLEIGTTANPNNPQLPHCVHCVNGVQFKIATTGETASLVNQMALAVERQIERNSSVPPICACPDKYNRAHLPSCKEY